MATAESPLQNIEHMPEFRALQDYVESMKEVEAKAGVFNRLSESRDLHPLGDLVSFAFHERLPESFYTSSSLYVAALREASYPDFDPSRFRSDASWQAEKLAENFLAALFRRNPFGERLQQLAQDLQGAAVQRSEMSETERFQKLVGRISDVQSALAGTELVWAFQRQFNLGPGVASVLKTMGSSAIFDPGSAKRIEEAGRSGFSSFQSYLATESSPITGTILSVRDGRPEMKLSEGTILLQGTLKRFLGQGFVAMPASNGPIRTELPPSTRLDWDAMLLDQATEVALAFERFRAKGLDQLPEELRPTFSAVALERTQAQVVDLIARAQHFEPVQPAVSQTLAEDELKAGITTFEAAHRPVDELMTALGSIRLVEPRRDLESAVSSEASRLLHSVDRLLDEQKAYEPRLHGFSWWDGTTPPSPAAWDADDETGVQIYLEKTRRRIADLAQAYAQPLLVWLTRTNDLPHDVRSLTDKWQGLLDDIRGYEAKKPGNPVAAIEDYILNQMPKVDARNCQAAVVAGLAAQTGDSQFANNLLGLSRQLAAQCYKKASSSALDFYREAARYFNQRLSGRYPFTSRPPGPSVPEADPEDVRAFFRLFDSCQKVFRSVPEGAAQESGLSDARSFLDRMARARAFFAPYLDAEKPDLYPSFDVEATFRILREREVAANQIISWTLEVGGERITDRETESRKLRWTLGEPVRLSLRWASNGPLVPVDVKPRAALSVQDREVVYEYRNRWSLLAALTDNRITPRDLPSYTDEQPVTLALAVYTRPTAGGPPGEIPTQVFLRLTVLKPGTTETLDPPPTFPERAPIPEGLMAETSR
jgi:type VI secretion system protein ImpL